MKELFLNLCKRAVRSVTNYFSLLLIFLILLFIFRPYDRGGLYTSTWQLCLTGVFISSIFNVKHSKTMTWAIISLGIPALISNWLMIIYQLPIFAVLFYSLTFLFIVISAISIVDKVILNARVTMETLRGVICVYLMIGFAFAFAYVLIEYLVPNSFLLDEGAREFYVHTHLLSQMMYFSFVTLLSIGFGTINAVQDAAQTIVIIEGMIGQFYVAILVARLIGVYSYYAHKSHKELFPDKK